VRSVLTDDTRASRSQHDALPRTMCGKAPVRDFIGSPFQATKIGGIMILKKLQLVFLVTYPIRLAENCHD
jgi:hypothetical protein